MTGLIAAYQSDQEALARLLASCDAFVHAIQEPPLVVLEATACGPPVVGVPPAGVAELDGGLARPRRGLRRAVAGVQAGRRGVTRRPGAPNCATLAGRVRWALRGSP